MRWFYFILCRIKSYLYKRKYGIPIDEGVLMYGKEIVITENVVYYD